MKDKFVILKSRPSGTRDVLFGARGPMAESAAAMREVTVDVDEITRSQLATLDRDRGVLAVAPAMPMKLIAPVGVPGAPAQPAAQTVTWGVKAVGADAAPFSGAGVVVAVLDTGIDASHAAFTGVELVQQDFTGEGNGDANGHGTHCAGTVFGRTVNGTRIGVAPGVTRALIGKVLGQNGGGSSEQIIGAMLWAVDQGAHVISMSLGMDFPGYVAQMVGNGMPAELATSRALEAYRANTQLFDTLAAHIRSRGQFAQPTLIVAAAGNESQREVDPDFEIAVSPPAIAEGIVSVAALGETPQGFEVARFSNTGANVSGPGVGVLSAKVGGGLRSLNGTSMATPHVAGVTALWAEKLLGGGRLGIVELTSRLVASCTSAGLKPGFDPFDVGAGLVRAPSA